MTAIFGTTYASWTAEYVLRHKDFVRGKCADATKEMVAAFPELKRVAGLLTVLWLHRTGPRAAPTIEQHWWCVAPDGSVVDPTIRQFDGAYIISREPLDLDDPEARRKVPTGKCMDCGAQTYEGSAFCSETCEAATHAFYTDQENI